MHKKDKENIINRYNKRLEEHGFSIKALASGSDERRDLRFKILTEVGLKDGDTILDLGCGFGDLHDHLEKNGLNVKYIGIDINEEIIKIAKTRKPNLDFRVCDILNDEINDHIDYIVSTSSFNNLLGEENNYDFVERLLNKCQTIATKGVAIDFLSSYVDFKVNDAVFYYEPEHILSIAKKITKRVSIRHDYELFEFCLYMYPDFKGWAKKE